MSCGGRKPTFCGTGFTNSARTYQGVHYRILYFFAGKAIVVLSHGLVKEKEVPQREIDLALERKQKVEDDFDRYAFRP